MSIAAHHVAPGHSYTVCNHHSNMRCPSQPDVRGAINSIKHCHGMGFSEREAPHHISALLRAKQLPTILEHELSSVLVVVGMVKGGAAFSGGNHECVAWSLRISCTAMDACSAAEQLDAAMRPWSKPASEHV